MGGTGSFFRACVPRSLVVLGLVVLLELLLEFVPFRVRDVRAREREGDAAEDEGLVEHDFSERGAVSR